MKKQILSMLFIVILILTGCQKYKVVKGNFVNATYKYEIRYDLPVPRNVPAFLRFIIITEEEFEKIDKLDIPPDKIKSELNIDFNNNLYILVYGWGNEPFTTSYFTLFIPEANRNKTIYKPWFKHDKAEKHVLEKGGYKLFGYVWSFNNGAFVSEFIELYEFKKAELKGLNYIEYDFNYKSTYYDIEPEQKWHSVTGNINIEGLAE